MDTVMSGSFRPCLERPIEVIGHSVGREDPAPPRHEARRSCLLEVRSPRSECDFLFGHLIQVLESVSAISCENAEGQISDTNEPRR